MTCNKAKYKIRISLRNVMVAVNLTETPLERGLGASVCTQCLPSSVMLLPGNCTSETWKVL